MCQQQPVEYFKNKAFIWKLSIESAKFAKRMDEEDPLASFRSLFTFPKKKNLPNVDLKCIFDENDDCLYLCGQSLGLKPKDLDDYVKKALDNWSSRGVHSHFHGGSKEFRMEGFPAALSDLVAKEPMARLVGAQTHEVAIMNALTVNLHILMATFYKPTAQRHKILIEEHAFSSDMYAVKSQLALHGYSPETSLITLKPRPGEELLRKTDIIDVITQEGDQLMMALLPAVQYYTGQALDIGALTKVCHDKGVVVGVDCAHAVGNVPLKLHDWKVDFAAWCTYKYLNSGAGGIGAIFVHEELTKNGATENFPILKGWWGNSMKTKFLMKEQFEGSIGADMFKMSNPSPVLNAMLMASLDIYEQTSIDKIREKQFLLTGYLEYLLMTLFPNKINKELNCNDTTNHNDHYEMPSVEIITPRDPSERGAQLSLTFAVPLTAVQVELQKRGVVCDIRMPSVMRVAPAPLYNSFTDVYSFVMILYDIFKKLAGKTESLEPEFIMTEGIIDDEDSLNGNGTAFSSATSSISCSDSEADSTQETITL